MMRMRNSFVGRVVWRRLNEGSMPLDILEQRSRGFRDESQAARDVGLPIGTAASQVESLSTEIYLTHAACE